MRRYVPLLFSTATTWCPETRQDVRIHVSEGRQLWGNPSHSLRAAVAGDGQALWVGRGCRTAKLRHRTPIEIERLRTPVRFSSGPSPPHRSTPLSPDLPNWHLPDHLADQRMRKLAPLPPLPTASRGVSVVGYQSFTRVSNGDRPANRSYRIAYLFRPLPSPPWMHRVFLHCSCNPRFVTSSSPGPAALLACWPVLAW